MQKQHLHNLKATKEMKAQNSFILKTKLKVSCTTNEICYEFKS